MNYFEKKSLSYCLVLLVSALSCSGREEAAGSGEGGGGLVADCTGPAMEYVGCADDERVERFHFSAEENGCKAYNTCLPEQRQHNENSNFFASLQDCESACPPKKICENPSYPSHGIYLRENSVENGELIQTLTYSCSYGYHLAGPQVRECIDGVWSGEEPICQRTTCPDLSQPTGEGILNMHKLCSGLQTPDCYVVYSCEKKYQLVYGSPVRRCEADGTWSGEQPYCGKLVIKHDGQEVEFISIPDGNENLEIDCIMIPHFPPNLLESVHWLPGNRNTSWTTDNSSFQLKFERVHLTDSGDYKCEVSGDSKKIERRIEIKVKEAVADGWIPDLFLVWPQSNKFLCAFNAKPKADVSWYVNGSLLAGDNTHYTFADETQIHQTFSMATLLIHNPTESDYNARYQCVGENVFGQASSNQLTLPQLSAKRSAPTKEDGTFHPKDLCSSDSVVILGKVRRTIDKPGGGPSFYHISVDKPLVTSRPIAQSVIKASSSSSDSPTDVQRHRPYIFMMQRTDDNKYSLNTVLPHTDNLESIVSQLCS